MGPNDDLKREWTETLECYLSRNVHTSNERVLRAKDALQLIHEATRCGVRVLGVDGFFLEGPSLRAASEWITDSSGATFQVANRAARQFVIAAGAAGAVVILVFERS